MNFFRNIGNFFGCLISESCEYSIKKILTYAFSILIIYLVICTDKVYYELLIFVSGLLGMRAFERVQSWKTPEIKEPEGNFNQDPDDGPKFSSVKKPKVGSSDKRLLTD